MLQSVSVVVPVYNSAATLDELVARLIPVLEAHSSDHEILLVDDGSPDDSWRTIVGLVGRHEPVQGVELAANYGQRTAVLAGVLRTRMEVIVTMDDDLQHPPEEIPKLLAALSEGHDVVYGRPRRVNHPWWRVLVSHVFRRTYRAVSRDESALAVSGFRAFHARLRDSFNESSGSRVPIHALLRRSTANFGVVTVRHEPRRAGTSGYTLPGLLRHAVWTITGSGGQPGSGRPVPAYLVSSETAQRVRAHEHV